jgi:hypothetical protein
MPLTFPSHAAAVLPLKRWRPRWFDGVALVIGSASPDLAYALDGSRLPVFPLSHQWHGLVLFCLPVTLLGCVLVRWAAPVVSAHLPGSLTAYGILGCRRPRLFVTAASALIGAASHLIWDRLAVGAFDLTSTVVGGALALFLLLRYPPTTDSNAKPDQAARAAASATAGRDGEAAFGGRAEQSSVEQPFRAPRARPLYFWPVAVAVTSAGVAVALRMPGAFLVHTTGSRVLIALAAGMLAGAVCVRAPRARPATAG